MTCEDQVFVANVMAIDLTWEIVATIVIIQPKGAIAKLNAIAKICKYRGFHDKLEPFYFDGNGGAPKCDIDRFIRECAHLFHDRRLRSHLSFSFYI